MKPWAEIISDLRDRGMTYAQIGEATGLAGSSIGDLASGRSKSPRGDAALRLHHLHSLKVEEVPDPHRPPAANEGAAAESEPLSEAA